MSNKPSDNKKRSQPAKVIKARMRTEKTSHETGLINQYNLIRSDLVKLRDDLSKGYDLAKEWIDKKGAVKNLLRVK